MSFPNVFGTPEVPDDMQLPPGMDKETFQKLADRQQREAQEMAFRTVAESCPGRTVASGVIGFGAGAAIGVFMSSVEWNINDDFLRLSTREQMRQTLRDMGSRTYSSAKSFAVIGAVFASSECVIESFRAKHDIYNNIMSGCFAGAAMSARAGPRAMVAGCAGFAAFSGAIEMWMNSMDS
ncbi:Mitochondrial import inner membrane translocase subunit tim22 [Polyrhizophydium stewartii]|uniref:Mitochondrial import inner membrane translocase subunit TIM22 n=1 Tax=Polyrhizophydium stewartii TaxID=2732419 RepID=A0ABR4N775_9FUNG|nr:Mitochondrial import inner membrane translocase subunit tim22 [Polyrhizophydium stewartii]